MSAKIMEVDAGSPGAGRAKLRLNRGFPRRTRLRRDPYESVVRVNPDARRLPLLDTVRLLYPVNVRLNRGLVYGLVWIGKLATEMIGQYIVVDEVLESCEQRRLCAGHIFQFQAAALCRIFVELVFLSG
jgi:hypothetical protein